MKSLIIFFSIILQCGSKILIPNNLKVHISSLKQCYSNGEYPVEVYNIMVNLDKGKIIVTGSLTATIDLTPPITAILKVEKDELGAWIEIPCINSVGSCTYSDLCVHSIPSNGTCPESFADNNVPCRCPIPKGNYTIPSAIEFEIDRQNYFSVYTGNYWTKVLVTHKNLNLACYEVYFEIVNEKLYREEEENNVYYSNNHIDEPFVTLL